MEQISVQAFLSSILNSYYLECTVLIAFSNGSGNVLSSNNFDKFLTSISISTRSFLVENLSRNKSNRKCKTRNNFKSVSRRFIKTCVFSLNVANENDLIAERFQTTLRELVNSRSDYFVFIAPIICVENLNQKYPFLETLKNKIFISESANRSELIVQTICNFCGLNGQHNAKNISLDSNVDKSSLFPNVEFNLHGKKFKISAPIIEGRIELTHTKSGYVAKRGIWKTLVDGYLSVILLNINM